MSAKPKILYLVTEDWYFWSHRLLLAREAQCRGFDVVVATRVREHGDRIRAEGFKLIPLGINRKSINPVRELSSILEIAALYRQEKPDIVHHVSLKPILYGSMATVLSPVTGVVNAVTGLGHMFSSRQLSSRLLRPLIRRMLRFSLQRAQTITILQNQDDRDVLTGAKIVSRERTALIRGSGVDLRQFPVTGEPAGIVTIVLAARLLWGKGVGDFVTAAEMLKAAGVPGRFLLVGDDDPGNRASVPLDKLQEWHSKGSVEWLGKNSDMAKVFAEAHIVCLPSSYGEGVPKVLIEAAAAGRPIVTTDMPGCREIVRNNENGLLVPPHDPAALATALRTLIENPALRRQMGMRGHETVAKEFTIEQVVAETMTLYERLL